MACAIESFSPVCPSLDYQTCEPSTVCMGSALDFGAASALRASAACTSLEWWAAVPAATATVRAVLSVTFGAEVLQTLMVEVDTLRLRIRFLLRLLSRTVWQWRTCTPDVTPHW
jgi:hypothetical protein